MNSKRGPAKGKKVRGNSNARALSAPSKVISGIAALEHMGLVLKLLRDSLGSEMSYVARIRREMGLPKLSTAELNPADDDGKSMIYDGTLMVASGDKIVALRTYRWGFPPESIPIEEGDRWVAHNMNLILERETHADIGGKIVTMGQVIGKRKNWTNPKTGKTENRKDLNRIASSPLRSVVVRLMPHEARAAGEWMTGPQLERAIDQTVADIEKALGCEVVSAAAHRMKDFDLHIHIQYTMVLCLPAQSPEDVLRESLRHSLDKWEKIAVVAAKSSLESEGRAAFPSAIGKRIRVLTQAGELPPKPTEESEARRLLELPATPIPQKYKKFDGLRSLNNKTILGYSLKHKLNMVRELEAAQKSAAGNEEIVAGLENLRQRVIDHRDGKKKTRELVPMPDATLDAMYFDLWLERQWRMAVVAQLPAAEQKKLPAAAVADANNYVVFGTTRVEQGHLDRHNADVAERLKAAESAMAKTKETIAEIEKRIIEETARLEAHAAQVNNDRADVLKELQTTWLDIAAPEDVAAIEEAVGDVPSSREIPKEEAEESHETSISGWMDRIKIALVRKESAVALKEKIVTSRESAMEAEKTSLANTRVQLAGKVRNMRRKIRDEGADKVREVIWGVTALVLGKNRADRLFKDGADPKVEIGERISLWKRAENLLSRVVTIHASPGTPADQILKDVKVLVKENAESILRDETPPQAVVANTAPGSLPQ